MKPVMKKYKYYILYFVTIVVFIVNQFYQFNEWYCAHIYPDLSFAQCQITKLVSFSIGDVVYFLVVVRLLYGMVKTVKQIIKHKKSFTWQLIYKPIHTLVNYACIIYICFQLLWGYNYNINQVKQTFGIQVQAYTKQDLCELNLRVRKGLNKIRTTINLQHTDTWSKTIIEQAISVYQQSSKQFTFLPKQQTLSLKTSLWSSLGNYVGFTGYYNPFSGEAQVRSDIPAIEKPFICLHELAHQLGFANESEASFLAFWTSLHSSDLMFMYSALLELKFKLDRACIANGIVPYIDVELNELVKSDIQYIKIFYAKNRSQVADFSNIIYNSYLKSNGVERGLQSYDDVVDWVISYEKIYNCQLIY